MTRRDYPLDCVDHAILWAERLALRALARRRWSSDAREDVTQAARIAAWKAWGRLDPARRYARRAFLVRWIEGAILDEMRRLAGRNNARGSPLRPWSLAPGRVRHRAIQVPAQADPGPAWIDAADAFEALIRPLYPRDRELVRAIYARGATQEAHARAVGLCQARISELHAHALAYLRTAHAGRQTA